jgi:hypothetical protein
MACELQVSAVSRRESLLEGLRQRRTIGERPLPWRLRSESLRSAAGENLEGVKREYGQANTGPWWMPRSCLAKKVVVSCEKPRGGAHIPRSADDRMG